MAGVDTDWREFRARLILNSGANKATELEPGTSGRPSVDAGFWAHSIPRPERGCLLIAHPLMFIQSQTYFAQVGQCKPAFTVVVHAEMMTCILQCYLGTCALLLKPDLRFCKLLAALVHMVRPMARLTAQFAPVHDSFPCSLSLCIHRWPISNLAWLGQPFANHSRLN